VAPPSRHDDGPAADDLRAGALFAAAFAVSALFESVVEAAALKPEPLPLTHAATAVAAIALLGRPSSGLRLLTLGGAFATALVVRLPLVPNHGLIEIGMCLALGLAAVLARRHGEPTTTATLVRRAAPAIRWSLFAMYTWAVVQKLNRDFFDPSVSCGPAELAEVRRHLWWLVPDTPALRWFGIYGTLVVETAIPVLLATRARHLGMLLAFGFHWVLGAGYARFSAMLVATLVLFADPSVLRGAAALWNQQVPAAVRRRLGLYVQGVLGIGLLGLVTRHAGGPMPDALRAVTLTWLAYGAVVAVLFGSLVVWQRAFLTAQRVDLAVAGWALALVPLALLLNGFAPHLGLKNTQVFAMYSNLRTEDGTTNHLFLPASLQVFSTTRDLVTIVESSDPTLARLARRQWGGHTYFFAYIAESERLPAAEAPRWTLPHHALRRRVTELALAGHRDVRVVYERGGVRHEVSQAERDPDLAGASWLARKFLLLRAVPMTDRGYCMW
jgi:hypothetical protein